jgi:methyl-accepting chemotaxis protein
MKLAQMTVKSKLVAGFGLLSAVVLLVSGYSLKSLNDSNARLDNFVHGINARAELAESVRTAVDNRAIAIRNLVLVTKPEDVALEQQAVLSAHQAVQDRLQKFNTLVANSHDMSDDARRLAAEIGKVEAQYSPVALDIDNLAMNNKRDQAIAEIDAQCRPLLRQLAQATDAYLDLTHERAAKVIDQAEADYAAQRNLLILCCFAAVGLAVAAGILITRSLMRSLGSEPAALNAISQRIASGNLQAIEGLNKAHPDSVLASMGKMQAGLVTLIEQVRSAATSIAHGSSEIATGNVDLSSRTEEQAAALQQTAASLEELTATVKQNASNAQDACTLALTASDVSRQGNEVVGQVVATMGDIRDSSDKIANITGIIEGIAFQTNILALNAAVEAARAGEQGRGFAVVASEVRTLAQRSSSAAKEIKELIQTSVQKVQDGAALAGNAGKTMGEVTEAVARVTTIMEEIASASGEQSHGIEQVNLAIAQMDTVTQQNAALVEEATAASQSLQNQGRLLTDSIATFQVEGGIVVAPAPAPARQRARADKPHARKSTGSVAPRLAGRLAVAPAGASDSWEKF